MRLLRNILPPAAAVVLLLILWEGYVDLTGVPRRILPAPSAIWDAFRANTSLIWEATRVSGLNALIGLIVGTAIGVAIAFVLARFRLVEDLLSPLAVALNAIPIFVLVAVFNNMYPVTSEVPRRLMVTLVVYFIFLINVARGLREVGRVYLDLMRSYAASDVTILRKVRVPHAVPYLFTALKIAAPADAIVR